MTREEVGTNVDRDYIADMDTPMTFEVVKKPGRKPRWRLLDEAGQPVPLANGRVHLPPTIEENRRVRDAVDAVLTRIAREQASGAVGR